MAIRAVIFDMDGLLIDSEPIWEEVGKAVLASYGQVLTHEQYLTTTGLRTREWLEHWFNYFSIDEGLLPAAERQIIMGVINAIGIKGKAMPGVGHILDYFSSKGLPIGLATSSPLAMAYKVVQLLGIHPYFKVLTSAEHLPYGKPHPQVYLDCAEKLGIMPADILCFEDSVNGMVAAKAAKMKCVVVPAFAQRQWPAWGLADLRISSLQNFNDLLFYQLDK